MENTYQCFVVVDEEGNIIFAQQGINLVATEDYDFGFIIKEEIEIDEWKVVIEKMKPHLVRKED